MSTNEKLECLKNLQVVLQKKFELQDQKEAIPADLTADEALLKEAQIKHEELNTLYENLTAEFQKLCVKYEDACNQRIEYEKQIEFLSTAREFESITKVLEEARTSEQVLLKLRNSKSQELERVQAELAEQSETVAELEKKVGSERATYQAAVDAINVQIDALDAELAEIRTDKITPEVYEKFANIVRKKDGLGIVPVRGQVCMGCDLILPTQFVIDLEIKNRKGEIEYCPYCSRIIYKEAVDEDMERNYNFEQLESATKSESRKSDMRDVSGDDGFDESMGMGDDFDEF